MVAYNFQEQFASDVTAGRKTQTIRALRKNGHATPGQPLQLYCGLRHRGARKLRIDPICTGVTPCAISEAGVTLDGKPVDNLDAFARLDGFADFAEMRAWFQEQHGLPFVGVLVKWQP